MNAGVAQATVRLPTNMLHTWLVCVLLHANVAWIRIPGVSTGCLIVLPTSMLGTSAEENAVPVANLLPEKDSCPPMVRNMCEL